MRHDGERHEPGKQSRPVWGAWIEISYKMPLPQEMESRAPYGARGLKCAVRCGGVLRKRSRAPYGARGLKSRAPIPLGSAKSRRAPYGARGLKFIADVREMGYSASRAPYGARGLKLPGSTLL